MHEIGIIQNALELAQEAACREGASQIHRVRLRIGRLAGVEPESLQLAFEVAREQTLARRATLEVESVPIVCWCACCEQLFESDSFIFCCPSCGQISEEVRQGREIELASLEVS